MRHLVFGLVIVLGCGGETKPAQDDTALLRDQPSATATSSSAPHADQASEEVARGTKALEAGEFTAAKSAFEAAIAKNARDADAHHYLGVTLEKQNDKTGAEREYKAALAIRPDLAEAAANLGAIYLDAQRWDDAIAALKPAVARRADSSAAQFNLALAYAGKGDQVNATQAFEAAAKLAPTDAMVLYTYGHTLATWNQNDQAIAKLRAAANAAASQGASAGDLLGSIGHELLLLRAVPDCIAALDKAIAAKEAAQFRTERALCKIANKDEPGAITDLETATKNEPSYGLAHYWLATRRMAAKRWSDGAKELEAYLKLEPNGPKAKSAREALVVAKNGGKKK